MNWFLMLLGNILCQRYTLLMMSGLIFSLLTVWCSDLPAQPCKHLPELGWYQPVSGTCIGLILAQFWHFKAWFQHQTNTNPVLAYHCIFTWNQPALDRNRSSSSRSCWIHWLDYGPVLAYYGMFSGPVYYKLWHWVGIRLYTYQRYLLESV